MTLGRSDRAVEACLDYLRRSASSGPPHPTEEEVRQEYERIWRQLGSRSIEELVDLPLMTDPDRRATMDVLTALVAPALFTDENLLCLVVCRMANLSLEHGNSDGSCFAYVWLGHRPRGALSATTRRVPLRQARPGSGGAARAATASRPASTCLRASAIALDAARPHGLDCPAARASRRRRRPATSPLRATA